MTTSNDPDEIRAEIERTRQGLSDDVDALADQANPKHIAQRKVDDLKQRGTDLKDRIMGSASDTVDDVRGKAQGARGTVGDAPGALRRKSQGNPLGVGLVAFGAGLLVSSLIPASDRERQAAVGVKEKAQPLTQKVGEAAKEVAGNLKEPAQQAASSVKDTATDAAQHVKEQSQESASEVKGTAQDAGQEVRDQSASSAGEVRDQARPGGA